MSYLKYQFKAAVVMLLLSLHTWVCATDVVATDLKQNPAPSKQLRMREFDIRLALGDSRPLGVRLSPTVLTLPGESFPVAVAGGLASGISALYLCYPTSPCDKNAVRFVTALEVLKSTWV